MKEILVLLLICLCSLVLCTSDDEPSNEDEDNNITIDENNDESDNDEDGDDGSDDGGVDGGDDGGDDSGDDGGEEYLDGTVPSSNCWMTLNAAEHFKTMDEIDDRYFNIREAVQKSFEENNFDAVMIQEFIAARGAAHRELNAQKTRMIPSGLNLGGFCMVRMPESILFFHRMKLRNNTYFRVDYLHNDIPNMMVRINLALNDLHLKGAYERSISDRRPNVLIYSPTFGEVEFLMKDVKYKIEGRYRVVRNRLLIELISSEIICDNILMTYINQAIESTAVRIEKENLGSFLSKMKTDLDQWLKDYFNDYLTLDAQMDGISHMPELAQYDMEKTTALEEFADKSINAIVTRIRLQNAETIRVPSFTFMSIHGLQIKLYDGVLHGLDTMYRRSVATGYKQRKIRKVDSVVGFSNLKVVYKYEAIVPSALPPLAGVLTLSANELTAHLALAMVSEPETVDLDIEFLGQAKPESLTLEGGANMVLANFKHLLEHEILTIMSNSLIYSVVLLKALPRCEPFTAGHILKKEAEAKQDSLSVVSSEETNGLLRKKKTHSRQRSPMEKQKSIGMKQLHSKDSLKKNHREQRKNVNRKRNMNMKKIMNRKKNMNKKKINKKEKQ